MSNLAKASKAPVSAEARSTTDAGDESTVIEGQEAADLFDGRVQGGWGWVGAAYGISLAMLLLYVLATVVRLRRCERRSGRS